MNLFIVISDSGLLRIFTWKMDGASSVNNDYDFKTEQ